ncbi:Formylglycine-generating enzyme, required for sulfatase activity, contains SUMF1/FGE domain [Salegentibacter echinorum]|uniref:Formylglycine-generating enzyme, required for sulfatase activity, contains SUMF1/FGE domain n=1 Tax=Salegentibacter echinorum TaxID=1073325 RepID=A0A1M5GG59_SALEC|nr:formylglycine-generating enzyme family protein [Salegentibacter echinorum]SHG02703.1 Formylglycine-generating enzyme, required for sulfatase activity, contains SUMF1/FGE domain [Salegentibacter echinorum]
MRITSNLFILLFLLQAPVAFTQEVGIEDYTQEIAGSDLIIEMVSIPKGTFTMGSPNDETYHNKDEAPSHKVTIDAFLMSKYEITWDLYNLFLNRAIDTVENTTKSSQVEVEIDAVSGATIPYVDMSLGMGTGEGLPVANVTHHAASKFCEWLSAKTGHFYRLPTEAEWEYAARAGTTAAFHFGDDEEMLGEYAWYYENSEDTYHKVGQKKPNPWGLYDMYGNVAEWTLDQYLPQTYKTRKAISNNPVVFPVKEYPRSVRGGSYYDDARYLRSAARLGSTENWKMRDPQFPKSKWWNTDAPFVGFRIVRVITPPKESDYKKYWGSKAP